MNGREPTLNTRVEPRSANRAVSLTTPDYDKIDPALLESARASIAKMTAKQLYGHIVSMRCNLNRGVLPPHLHQALLEAYHGRESELDTVHAELQPEYEPKRAGPVPVPTVVTGE